MNWELIFNLLTALMGGTGLVGFLAERKKRRNLEKQGEADALGSMQKVYDEMVKHTSSNITAIHEENIALENEIKLLTKQFKTTEECLKSENQSLILELKELNKNYDKIQTQLNQSVDLIQKLEKKVNYLETELKKYKKVAAQ